jgi:hypothetical protein
MLQKRNSCPCVREFFCNVGRILAEAGLPVARTGTLVAKSTNPALRHRQPDCNLKYMKKVYLYLVAILLFIGAIYIWGHRSDYSLLREWLPARQTEGIIDTARSQQFEWRPVDESSQGFKLEMPGDPQRVVVQATNEAGNTEPVSMLLVKPDSERTYAIAWAEKPPVARMNDLVPDKTLDQARDGAMNKTNTTLVSEIRSNPQGFPGRDVVTRNAGGGILDTRFVYAGARLYMLIATAPSASARHEEDVFRFFNSFAIASNTQIPETIPAATQ